VEQEERRLKAVLHGAADAILMLDVDGQLGLANPAAQQLFTDVDTRLGQPLPMERGYDVLITLLDQARHSHSPAQGEIAWPDGRTFAVLVTPLADAGQVAILHDVSHFKELEKVKNEFIAAASHDLKNPLTAILGYSDLVEKIGPLTPQQADFMLRMRGAAKHMHELVLNLLELARLDMGVELKLERFDIRDLLTQIAEEYRPQADRKHQTLQLAMDTPLPLLGGDVMRLSQVVRNLVGNAIKYTLEDGLVTVNAEAGRDLVRVKIQDTGLGIPAADLPHIFDKFYRVQSDATQEIEGNGLGLSIVKTIVEKHGGHVSVESTLGRGSCFMFTLPATQPAAPAGEPAAGSMKLEQAAVPA
jgi:two-component system phosphate regulon sensor histidine kinase PhoR